MTTISSWESRSVAPAGHRFNALCEYFYCEPEDLLSDNKGAYAKLHGLDSIPPSASIPNQNPEHAYAMLYGRGHAGDATDAEIRDGAIPIPCEVLEAHQNGYFLEVEGTCMSMVYPEGCHVFIDPTLPPTDGAIAVVSIDRTDFIMRRLKLGKSTVMLVAESYDDEWEDLVFHEGDGHDISMVGTVVWYQAPRDLGAP